MRVVFVRESRTQVNSLSVPAKLVLLILLGMLLLAPPAFSQSALSITVTTNKTQYSSGESVLISGTVRDSKGNPALGAEVSIEVDDSLKNPVHVQLVLSDQSGGYVDQFSLRPDASQGQYTIYATASLTGSTKAQSQMQISVFANNASTSSTPNTQTSSSSSATTNPSGKCLIATATFGSELTPEVSMLRNFRDLEILQTSAGERFMRVFNAFYYSLSPGVASFITSHEDVRGGMKMILYPLIGILYVSRLVFGTLSFNGEIAVSVAGILASFAIGAVYVGPTLTLLSRVFRPRPRALLRTVQATSTFGFASATGLVLAELSRNAVLLEATTTSTVLSSIVLGAVMVPWMVLRTFAPNQE